MMHPLVVIAPLRAERLDGVGREFRMAVWRGKSVPRGVSAVSWTTQAEERELVVCMQHVLSGSSGPYVPVHSRQ
jgi:hypothetical protein